MKIKVAGGMMLALCASLSIVHAVYAQQGGAPPDAVRSYHEQSEQLRASLRQGVERLQKKQQALMAWLQEGSQQLQSDQQQMEVVKQGLEQLESNRRYLEWLQQGMLQLQAEQAYMVSLREDIERLQRSQQQTLQQWLDNESGRAAAAEMERKRLEAVRLEAEKRLADEAKQADAAAMQLKQVEAARREAEQKRAGAAKQAEALETMQVEMTQLEADQKQVQHWLKTAQPGLSETPPGQLDAVAMDAACSERFQAAHRQFASEGFTKELWLQHVFECQECCAPILTDVMEQHVTHVAAQPHTVVLFDFDNYVIKSKYKEQLQRLMTTSFDASRDKVLLIGRASKIGDRGYNMVLSGKRAGEIRDYLMSTFDVAEENIHYQFFGFDPPQLTLDYGARYGISAADLSAVDAHFEMAAEAKINQSVEVIIYKGDEMDETLKASKGGGSNANQSSSKN